MKTLKDVMSADVVWISPAQQVKSAIFLLKGHGIDALPVVYAHDSVVGMLYCSSLIGQNQDSSVMDVMDKNYTAVPSDTPVYQAAEMMKVGGNSHLLVVDAGKLIGIVSRSDIVAELGKSYDTLTKLPWQDAFREWGISALDHGFEISVILIDLDSFGKFNKRYGHVIGDNVLKSVAEILSSSADPEKDFLCRYAGDEFAIASYRKSNEATEFGRQLMEKISRIEIPGLSEKISATFGMAGGRRSGGREQVHSAAMLDDLITNASLNCTASKPVKAEEPAKPTPTEIQQVQPAAPPVETPIQAVTPRAQQTRLKIQTIRLSTSPAETTVQVVLSLGDTEFSHSVTGYSTGGRSLLRLVAEATASAASKSLPADHGIMIDDVITFKAGDDREVVSVIATLITTRNSNTCAGSAVVKHADPYRAAAAALLSATNRQLSLIPKEGAGKM
ncbi:MAG: CBS domain-containing protein [Armatimonadota bacterium]